MQFNYGILSTSSIAPRFIAAVREANAGHIAAVSSRTLEKAQEKAKEWDIPKAYGNHKALLEDEDVNIVTFPPSIPSITNGQRPLWKKASMLFAKSPVPHL